MKKKIKPTLFVFIIIGVIVLNITYKNKNEVTKTKQRNQNNLAIMIKGDSGEYVSSNEIPKGNYVLNEEKTICENGGKVVSYNNLTGQIGFSFLGSDRCSLYFDKIIDTQKPVISNLKVNGKTITATLTDNEGLKAYGFSTSNTVEPTSWTTISGKTYNLNTTINTEGTYYLWVKDGVGNKAVSDVIDLENRGWKTILANNTVNETTPDFSKVAKTNEGLFKADDDYTATTGMKSYYFRGAVDNNWVKFGKDRTGKYIYWRIIRINGDGSIRMIYTGTTAPTESTKVVMTGEGTQIGKSTFNSSKDNAEYVGYMYAPEQQHGTSTSSDIKTTIDNWYETTTLKTDSATKSLVADQIFCNDRSPSSIQTAAWTSTGANYSYGANGRISSDKTPILKCGAASDKFTSKNSSIGNKALEYPVGLITADEIAMAGGVYGSSNSNSSYYLYTNQFYWSGSPYYFRSSGIAYGFTVSSLGYVTSSYVPYDIGARPVISLSSEAKLTGDGTWNNVYEVEKKGYETILANNTVHETAPDFTKTATTNEGLFKAQDDLGTSYYFRGAVDNNWVKYGKYTKDMYNCNNGTISNTDTGNSCIKIASKGDDMYWRIIRINGDNSIRMIYSGVTPPTESTKVIKTTDTSLGNSPFNQNKGSAEYVGYMYEIGKQHGTSQSSDIKTYLDNWYANYTDLNKTGTKITDQIYCNDRTASTSDVAYSTTNYTTLTSWNSTGTTYYYGAYGRIVKDNKPMLTCAVDSDRFTVNKINGKGNSALTYPIGLITIDEVEMAGNNFNESVKSHYLYTGAHYWTGTPAAFDGDFSFEYSAMDESGFSMSDAGIRFAARGVVSLSSESKLLGSGTYNDVYIVS